MTDRSVIVRLQASVAEYKRGMTEAKTATEAVGKATEDASRRGSRSFSDLVSWTDKNEQHLNTLTTQAGLLGAGLTAAAALGVKSFANFDQSMSNVAATGEDARANISALRDAALDAGARTVFSATEAAGAIEELSKAGLSATQILGGGLDGALNLAAAGQLEVADAAQYTSVALAQFKLDGSQASHVADLLAAGAGKATGEVSDMGQALAQGGLVAAQTGLSIEETTGALAAFAKAGLLGSDAGTSLKTMLQRLTPQSKEAQAQFDELGISAYDAQGNFVGLADFAGQLQTKMSDLTPEARNAALSVMFGSDAVRAASVLYDQGAEGIQTWISAVDDSGYAAEAAQTRLDNLKGDLEALGGAFETAMIKLGEGGNGPLRSLVQSATDVVNRLSEMPSWAQTAALAIVGGGGLALLGTAGMLKLATATTDGVQALQKLGVLSETATDRVGRLGVASAKVGASAVALVAVAGALNEINAASLDAVPSVDQMTAALLRAQGVDGVADAFSGISETFDDMKGAADRVFDSNINTWVDRNIGGLLGLSTATGTAEEAFTQLGSALAQVYATDPEEAERRFAAAMAETGRTREELLSIMGPYADALAATDAQQQLAGGSATDLAGGMDEAAAASEEARQALEEWVAMVSDSDSAFINMQGAFDAVIAKNQEYAQSTADATSSSDDSWEDYYDGVAVSAADYIGQLQAQVDAQTNWESNMLAIAERVKTGMTGEMAEAANGMIDELLDLGPEGAAQVQLLKEMTDEQFAQVVTLWSQKGTAAVTEFTNKVESYRNPVIDVDSNVDAAELTIATFVNRWANYNVRLNTSLDTSGANEQIQDLQRQLGIPVQQANGSVLDFFANGSENHVAQIAPAGAWRVWAEPETGGEGYIPLAPSKRQRSEQIMSSIADRFGGQYVPAGSRRYDRGGLDSELAAAGLGTPRGAAYAPTGASVPVSTRVAPVFIPMPAGAAGPGREQAAMREGALVVFDVKGDMTSEAMREAQQELPWALTVAGV